MYRQMNHLVEKIVYDTPSFSICSNKAGSFNLHFSQEVKKIKKLKKKIYQCLAIFGDTHNELYIKAIHRIYMS